MFILGLGWWLTHHWNACTLVDVNLASCKPIPALTLISSNTLATTRMYIWNQVSVTLTKPGLMFASLSSPAADTIWKGREFSGMKIAALVLITTGVLLILLPENWHEFLCKHVRCKRRDEEQEAIGNSTTLRSRLSRTSYMWWVESSLDRRGLLLTNWTR